MKVYNFLKDFLVYSILGFILVPVKFLFWIFSADGWFVISHLGEILQGNVKVPNAWKGILWILVAVVSWYVFNNLHVIANEYMKAASNL